MQTHDKDLRARERLLSLLLSRVLKSELPRATYAAIGSLNKGFAALREQPDAKRHADLDRLIEGLSPAALSSIIRAFNLYFSLLNIAEETALLRHRRQLVKQEGHMWTGSFHDTLIEMKEQGIRVDELQILLDRLCYLPVLTAHPSESRRRTIKGALRNVFLSMAALDDPRTRGMYRDEVQDRLSRQIRALWKTDEVRAFKLDVRDEIDSGLSYFPQSLFEAVARIYRNFAKAVRDVYGDEARTLTVPAFLNFGSWIGGDRDGHPGVTTEVTALAWRSQALVACEEYLRRLDALFGELSLSDRLCRPSADFLASLEEDARLAGRMFGGKPNPHPQEPYRRKIEIMQYRLRRNRELIRRAIAGELSSLDEPGYATAAAFLGDLRLIRDSLASHGDAALAEGELQDLIMLAETFGFHLMQLDVRQESTRHSEAVAELLKRALDVDYNGLDEAARIELLADAIANPAALDFDAASLSETAQETLRVFRLIAHMRQELGPDCFGRYVISMTHT
ncbi:MAG: phosphoenolpyruvate carboxylase, partial [Thiobacillus sp.]|nr:phosphoenolpyruvate carboxylase [Thiobacillus sp.]